VTDSKRTRTAVVIAAMLLLLPACGGPKLRESRVVSPEDLNGICGLTPTSEVTRSDAICIAGLAGLNLDPTALTVRASGELGGGPTWIVEEICDDRNPRCIGVAIRRSDGTIADTRYLYVFAQRNPKP
jgi:hypothetical protein